MPTPEEIEAARRRMEAYEAQQRMAAYEQSEGRATPPSSPDPSQERAETFEPSTGGAVARQFGHGASLGLSPYTAAGLASLEDLAKGRDGYGFDWYLEKARQSDQADLEQAPVAGRAARFAGGALTGMAGAAVAPATVVGQAAMAGGQGLVSGAAESGGDPTSTLASGAVSAGLGALGGKYAANATANRVARETAQREAAEMAARAPFRGVGGAPAAVRAPPVRPAKPGAPIGPNPGELPAGAREAVGDIVQGGTPNDLAARLKNDPKLAASLQKWMKAKELQKLGLSPATRAPGRAPKPGPLMPDPAPPVVPPTAAGAAKEAWREAGKGAYPALREAGIGSSVGSVVGGTVGGAPGAAVGGAVGGGIGLARHGREPVKSIGRAVAAQVQATGQEAGQAGVHGAVAQGYGQLAHSMSGESRRLLEKEMGKRDIEGQTLKVQRAYTRGKMSPELRQAVGPAIDGGRVSELAARLQELQADPDMASEIEKFTKGR